MHSWPTALRDGFLDGGLGMYWVLGCCVVILGVALRKGHELYRPRPSTQEILAVLERSLAQGDLASALSHMARTPGSVPRIALAGLARALGEEAHVEASLVSQLFLERTPLSRGLPLLMATGQIATLFGLLGVIHGLMGGFHHTPDASSRAAALARAISEAMNCTAFGLSAAITALVCSWVLHTRAHELDGELEHATCAIHNLIVRFRSRLRWMGARAPIERGSYRTME